MKDINQKLISSWKNTNGSINSTEELHKWIVDCNNKIKVNIKETSLDNNSFWFYDHKQGVVRNQNNSFFYITGIQQFDNNNIIIEQPIIVQDEIGFLGMIVKEVKGELNFLVQAKIEPGNINKVQLSPTIQATKSNFTMAHGGRKPNYLEYFTNAVNHHIIYDQIQSEQSSRFLKKRNRNMVIIVDEDVELIDNFRWMTLGQIKELMKIDNLVNMDTRTVIAGIPLIFDNNDYSKYFDDITLYNSIFKSNPLDSLPLIFNKINDYKMFNNQIKKIVKLDQLKTWEIKQQGIFSKNKADFCVKYYDIAIDNREVTHWQQPLFKAEGVATFALFMKDENNAKKFLVKLQPEMGTFDQVELGPTIQWESTHDKTKVDKVEQLFLEKLKNKEDFVYDVILSEEGGRFYHEQNNNYIIQIKDNELNEISSEYIWVDYATLNYLIQINNILNIQLRNLLSLIMI